MKRIIAVLLVVLSLFTYCGHRFGVRDRFEGVNKDSLRVYVRISNPDAYDGQTGEVKLKGDFQQKGKERARLLSAVNPGISFTGAGPDEGRLVFMECGDEYCEAFLDFKLSISVQEDPVKKTEDAR